MPLLNHLAKKAKHKVRHAINDVVNFTGNESNLKEEEREEDYMVQGHRFDSFAPIRHDAMVKYFIDGHDYCW
jgi:phospholipase D1/2